MVNVNSKKMAKSRWFLQVRHTTWVYWGYGKKTSVVHMDPVQIDLGHGLSLPFELPIPTKSLPAPQEYDRREGYGWRWQHQDGAGHSWHPASSVEDAVAQARDSLTRMRADTREVFKRAIKDVRVTR